MSHENVEIVRALLAPFEQGDCAPLFRDDDLNASITAASEPFFTPDFVCVFVREDVGRSEHPGLGGLREAWLDWLQPWDNYWPGVEEVIDAGNGRVVVLTRDRAGLRDSEREVSFAGAPVWHVRDGRVARIEFYWSRDEGLKAVGLEE